jgi:RNA polymerase sigma-70 factor (ECF subfamily)
LNGLTTTQLIELCRSGDARAAESLLRDYQPALFRLALSILDDPAEADEAAQDALVAAFKALESYRGQAAFRTWLFSIALNVCRERLRKRTAYARLQSALQAVFRLHAPVPRPEEVVIQNEQQAALWSALNRLNEDLRLPLVLRYYHELSIAEIAQVMNTSERTVYTRLKTAHERLRALLKRKVEF